MFWTDWGTNPRIERSDLDGGLRKTIIDTQIFWPNGLTIDYPTQTIYFADAKLDYIHRCDYTGRNRYEVVAGSLVSTNKGVVDTNYLVVTIT